MAANKKKRRKKKKSGRGKIVLLVLLFLMLLGLLGGVVVLKYIEKKMGQSVASCIEEGHEIAESSSASDFKTDRPSYLYAADGTQIAEIATAGGSNYLKYEQIPEDVVNAFVAIEDRTFWTNSGVDVKGMARIIWYFIRSRGSVQQGASTITQQLVKLTYLSTEKSLNRKLKEIVIARDITKKYSKEQIMEYYCNACCFANGVYGISDAARAYFDKDVEDLTLSETAYLCAIPNRPEYYNPLTNPDNALARRDKILDDMQAEGYITEAQCREAKAQEIVINEPDQSDDNFNYETTYAIHCAAEYIMELQEFDFRYNFSSDEDYEEYRAGYDEAFAAAKHELYTNGYSIYTSLDLDLQEKMQDALDSQLASFTDKEDNGIYQVQGAMTVIDNSTGKVVSIIGGRSQEETEGSYTLNRAYQSYFQPGSSIKPLVVYTPALDSGDFTANSTLKNIDVTTAKKAASGQISSMGGTSVTLRSACENSLNGCAYWLLNEIGVDTGLSYLTAMHFSKILPEDYNVGASLGGLSYGVTTEEMANAYYCLENNGRFTDTDCILSITDSRHDEIYYQAESARVYSKDAALAMTDVMKGVLTNGTAKTSAWYSYTETEAAGKTGTTNDYKAGWFCGYTPYYTAAVWVGCDTPTTIDGLTGSSYPLSIWEKAMLTLIDGKPTAVFETPDGQISEGAATDSVDSGCTCSTLCTEGSVDESCPICAEDYTNCKGTVPETCICTDKCDGDTLNESCPVCVKDPSSCQGKASGSDDSAVPETGCTCGSKCTSQSVDFTCPVCAENYENCTGRETSEDETDDTGDSQPADSSTDDSGTGDSDYANPASDISPAQEDGGVTDQTGGSTAPSGQQTE